MSAGDKKCPFCAETIKAEAIRCRYCGASLSIAAAPMEKKTGSVGKILLWIVLAFVIAIGCLIAIGSMSGKPSQQSGELSSSAPRADQQIWLDSSAIGCMSGDDLDRALDHYARSEYTAWAEITGSRYCFRQSDVAPSISWTVVLVRGDHMQVGLKRASEYSKNPDAGKFDYWTLTKWAVFTAPPDLSRDDKSASVTTVAPRIGAKSKPVNGLVPVRSTPNPVGEMVRSLAPDSVVEVFELKSGMVRISKKGKRPEWVLPEALDW